VAETVLASAGFSPSALPGAVFGGLSLVLGALIIGGIIAFIGNILTFAVGAFKLRAKPKLPLRGGRHPLRHRRPLSFISVPGILTLVGYISMYIALGDTMNKLSTAAAVPAQA
jgi:uncharacterized membrane protein